MTAPVVPAQSADAASGRSSADLIRAEEPVLAHNYHPLPVVVARAEGTWVEDVEGRRYLDMLAGYSALNFGHRHPLLIEAAHRQLDRLTLTSRAFHNDRLAEFAERLAELTGLDMVLPMNTGAEAVEWAPWEITRMPATGVAFWPTGGESWGAQPLASQVAQGHTWCDPSQTEGEGKLFADGAGGYLAYLLGDRLLVKQFQDQPASAAAPNEAEIELYVNPDHSYIEVENQGAFASIAPGQTVRWQVAWYVRLLPVGVVPSLGNPDLIAFVAQTLK
jgi:hypothetical protein